MAGVVMDKILAYLAGLEAGQAFGVGELKELGLSESQAATGMYRIVKADRWPVEVISAGKLWRNAAVHAESLDPEPMRFTVREHMGTTALLVDDEGWLWLAKRVGVTDS
jgi:hypothetical protein